MRAAGRRHGFTLIELMIAVAIVGILAALAYPSFIEQVRRSQRSDGSAALLELAQAMERWRTANGTYAVDTPTVYPDTSENEYYALDVCESLADNTCDGGTATAYVLRATPRAGEPLEGDATCGTLLINQAGVKCAAPGGSVHCNAALAGAVNSAGAVEACW